MSDTKQLIREFNQSKIGHVINGRESFRNRIGQYFHGATQHKILSAVTSIAVLSTSIALAGPVVGFIGSLPLWLPGAVSLVAPKKQEKAAADFLMNVAVRKSAALNNYLLKRGYDESVRIQAVDIYLQDQSPKFGYYKSYQAQHPQATEQIIQAGIKGDLPLCHSPELYHLEVLQEMLTQDHRKGGIIKGLWETITLQNIKREKQAKKIAEQRWHTRQQWMAQPPEMRSDWHSFYKGQEFQSQHTPPAILTRLKTPSQGFFATLKENSPHVKSVPQQKNQLGPEFLQRKLHDKYNNAA